VLAYQRGVLCELHGRPPAALVLNPPDQVAATDVALVLLEVKVKRFQACEVAVTASTPIQRRAVGEAAVGRWLSLHA